MLLLGILHWKYASSVRMLIRRLEHSSANRHQNDYISLLDMNSQ